MRSTQSTRKLEIQMAQTPAIPVRIRALERNDAASITALLENDAEGVAWTSRIPWPLTLADAHAWLDRVLGTPDAFAIEAGGQFAGCTGMHADEDPECADVGYWVGRPFRGQGVATGALSLVLDHARARGCRRAIASVFPGNEASSRVLTKHGFRFTREKEADLPLRGGLRRLLIFEREL